MIEAQQTRRLATLLWILLPGTLGAQTTQDQRRRLKALLEGKEITLKMEMPASKEGVDIHPEKAPQIDFSKQQKRINRYGVALRQGQPARITKIDIEKKHVEIHINGGGCCPYGWPTRFRPTAKSAKEIELEDAVDDATDRTKLRNLMRQLTAVRSTREQKNAQRLRDHEAKVKRERPRFGTRFNLRYKKRLTAEQITEESVVAALAPYADLPYLAARKHQELLTRAQNLMDQGSFLQAAVAWREVLGQDRENATALSAFDLCLDNLNRQAEDALDAPTDLERASRIWEAVLRFAPDSPRALAGMERIEALSRIDDLLDQADAHFAAAEFEEAKAAWAEVLRLDSNNSRAVDGIAGLPVETVEAGERYAVIIGVSQFQDGKIPPLRYTDDDARSVYETLTDPEMGDFPKENVQLLVDQDATSQKIKAAVGTWLRREAGENDTVVIFFAGHGAPETDVDDATQKTYWLTYDTRIDDLYSSALSNDEIADMLSRVRAQRIISFIDSCYSAATVNRTAASRGSLIVEDPFKRFKGEGRVTITSSDGRQESLELTEFGHGVFTHYLLEALGGKADSDGDGVILLSEVWDHVNRNVPETARRFGGMQTPIIDGAYSAGIELGRIQSTVAARSLDDLYRDELLDVSHYIEGQTLLKKEPEELSDCQKRIVDLLKRLIQGELTAEGYRTARTPLSCP